MQADGHILNGRYIYSRNMYYNILQNVFCFCKRGFEFHLFFFRSYHFCCGVWWCVSESAQDGCNCCFCICTIVYWKRLISNCTKSRVVVVPIDLMTTNQSIHSVMFCFCVVARNSRGLYHHDGRRRTVCYIQSCATVFVCFFLLILYNCILNIIIFW